MVTDATATIGGRLITAEEEKGRWIARGLHDDVSQFLAIMTIRLDALRQSLPRPSASAQKELDTIRQEMSAISSDIHDLSHQLHPSSLESLGLIASVCAHCKQFAAQCNLEIQFTHRGVPESLSPNVTLCLYRTLQEALWNVVKHSGTQKATVELIGSPAMITLCVSDSGLGFDAESIHTHQGLVPISMRERLRLIGGRLSIGSTLSQGTKVCATSPL